MSAARAREGQHPKPRHTETTRTRHDTEDNVPTTTTNPITPKTPTPTTDLKCKCPGCASCGGEKKNAITGEVSQGGLTVALTMGCPNARQKYINKKANGMVTQGYRRTCKPCIRRVERMRKVAMDAKAGGEGQHQQQQRSGTTRKTRDESTRYSTSTDIKARRESIVLFGDSLTERSFENGGFGARLADEFRRFADVKCRGYSGYNTDHALCVLPDVFPQNDARAPTLVTVLFGSNDACIKESAAGAIQHVPVQRYEDNLSRIVTHLNSLENKPRILFITPPPVHDASWLADCTKRVSGADDDGELRALLSDSAPNRTNAGIAPYVEAMIRVAEANHIPYVDLRGPAMTNSKGAVDSTLFIDGLHFSPSGQVRVAQLVVNAIEQYFPQLAQRTHDILKSDYPDWKFLKSADYANQISSYRVQRLLPHLN